MSVVSVVKYKSQRRTDPPSREVLPSVMCDQGQQYPSAATISRQTMNKTAREIKWVLTTQQTGNHKSKVRSRTSHERPVRV